MSKIRNCLQCGRPFEPKRPHQFFDSEECRYQGWIEKEVLAAQIGCQRVEQHPLVAARAQQEESETNRQSGLLIRQAIIDRLKTVGTCHADDLDPLYPANELERKRCRKLAGAQFGSLAAPRGGKEPLIREKERRKSSIPERKGAKSGVFEFTKAGWQKYGLSGVHADASSGAVGSGGVDPGEAGLTGPGSGAGASEPQGRVGALPSRPKGAGTASPDSLPSTGSQGQGDPGGGASPPSPAGAGEPEQLFDDAPPSAYDPWKDAA